MNLPIRPYPDHVPTLTEVIEFEPEGGVVTTSAVPTFSQPVPLASFPSSVPQPVSAAEPPLLEVEPLPFVAEPLAVTASVPVPVPEVSEAQLSQRVLSDVQRQIDSMLEFRLRESMQPLLAQFTETLMQDLRDELSRTMRDVVTRAVAQEVAKLRNR